MSQGADSVKTYVPDFSGKSEAQVYIMLMEHKLGVGKITYEKSDRTAGTIIEQSVEAMLQVPMFTEIDFTVSGGASYSGDGTTVPTKEDMKPAEPEETEPPAPVEPETGDDNSSTDDPVDNAGSENTDEPENTGSSDSDAGDTGNEDDYDWMEPGSIFKDPTDNNPSSSDTDSDVLFGDDFFGEGYN